MAQMVKCLSAMQETQVRSLGQEDSLEKETAAHSSSLAGKIPRTEEPGGLQSMGSHRVGHDWATSLSFTFYNSTSMNIPKRIESWDPNIYLDKSRIQKDACVPIFTAELFTIAKTS